MLEGTCELRHSSIQTVSTEAIQTLHVKGGGVCVCVCVCVRACVRACVCVCVRMCVFGTVHTCMHVHMYIRTCCVTSTNQEEVDHSSVRVDELWMLKADLHDFLQLWKNGVLSIHYFILT